MDADVFDDLGADSLTMAKFCARVRKDPQLPTLAIADVYACPSASGLAERVTGLVGADGSGPTTKPPLAVERRDPGRRVGTGGVALCGLVQIAMVLGWSYLFSLVLFLGYEWFVASPSLFELYRRSFVIGAVTFVFLCVFPVVVKWVAIGRWSPRTIRIWSLDYVRFWLVKTLTRLNPLVMFRGSPLYVLYLRALGARIGRDVAIFSQAVPVCTDLLTVGSGTVIRKDSLLSCYRARDGVIEIGPVSLGSNVFVGEATVLEIGTRIGDGGQLGHSSALPAGQAVPPGEHWHGSPARPCNVDYQPAGAARCGRTRKIVYSVVQLTLVFGVLMPISFGGVALLLREVPQLASLLAPGPDAFRHWYFYAEILGLSFVLYVGFLLVAVLIQTTALRALGRLLRPDRTYPLYGVHYFVQRAIALLSNSIRLTMLLGDSSAIPHYLRGLGYRLTPLLQTGNNFGMLIKHESPSLAGVGTGTVVADDLSIVNAHFTSTSFFVSRAVIGEGSFLGNRITYPSGARVGDDCLLGTKVMVPIDGPLREGVGILGSPPFEIPRTVARDARLSPGHVDLRQALCRKNRHNVGTMALHVLVRWLYFFGIALIIPAVALVDATFGAVEIVVAQVLIVVFTVGWFALVDRLVRQLLLRTPGGCSIYAPVFWGHERYWKVPAPAVVALFNGTPMKGMVWRLNGVNVGGRLFDDGASFIERPFTTIGDDCIFNERSVVQNHSQEDGSFKSDHTVLGSRVSIGVGAFVHYGVTIGDDVVIEADSFLMKGEEIMAGATWGGNPAKELSTTPGAVTP
ncbi:hypothetical protein AD006_31180 (plasmid) [Pseudonocardia sp. EC080610-09]|uniref:Pls/PosA family non-ribosomal peptide synthetase n=1 Tax=unclassified Pseudonocardia TaxID=2619320 RepID=UPI0007056F6A|nr:MULTISPECIES: Pls/PosA family non-ribosomal peptide synthetase [unclassified Pseudonocardia]ALL79647.1 hypothetical protein AD006_31180 [Pseudonocardia sp. EC080610-09]ALL85396.1 hypothetical protein AD017_30055 [Pseudonocardia sp. EC080619-01]